VKCIQVIESYDPKRTTVDAHIEDTPIIKDDKNVGEVERKFIHQVFYGCIRYQKMLKLFVTSFLYKYPATAIRSDQTLYMILGYLLFFRLEELGCNEFWRFLNSGIGTASALHALMSYAFNEDDLNKWVKMEWCKLYDVRFVEEQLIGKLQSYAEEMQPMMEEIELKATGTLSATGESSLHGMQTKKVTTIKPFNITKPKPRLIPEPEVISREIKAHPLDPNVLYKTSLEKVEEEKKQRLEEQRNAVMAKYGPQDGPALTTSERPGIGRKDELARQVDEDLMRECTFQPLPAQPVPEFGSAEVRQNVAAVLREDALVKKKQANEYQILKRYEEDLRDASEFNEWQGNMREKDANEEERRVHQRIVEMQLARDEAIEARETLIRHNHIRSEIQRDELRMQIAQREQEQHELLQEKQALVIETQENRQLTRNAEEEMEKEKRRHAEQIRKEKELEMERKRREDEKEMERCKDLIRQIRAIERVPIDKTKDFDASEPPNKGFLEEMSLAELRERLKTMSANENKECEDKRERQLEKKFEKQQEFAERVQQLQKIRTLASAEASERHRKEDERKREDKARQKQYREQCIEEAAHKIAAKKKQKKEEEMRLKKELKEISIKRQFLQANAEMVEAKAHGEQQKGLEREAHDRQGRQLLDQKLKNDIKGKETKIRQDNRERDQDEYNEMKEKVNKRFANAMAQDRALKDDIRRSQNHSRGLQRTHERRMNSELGHSSNKYSGTNSMHKSV